MRNGRGRVRVREGPLEELLRSLRDSFAGALRDSLRQVVSGVLRQGMTLFIGYALATVAILFGLVMLLNGVLHALRSIPLSDAAAYSIVGATSLAAGLIILLLTARSGRGGGD